MPTHSLIFRWGSQYRKPLKWGFALIVALSVHAILLYFVRVSPRPGGRVLPLQGRLIILNGDRPENRALLNRLEDKATLLPEVNQVFAGDVTWASLPSFHSLGYEPRFRNLPRSEAPPTKGGALTLTDNPLIYLPPAALSPTPMGMEAVPPPARASTWRASRELKDRLPAGVSLDFPPLADSLGYAFEVGVDSAGRVVFALPLRSKDSQIRDGLLMQLRALKFGSNPGSGIAWGQVEPSF
jgi:hypothetical protein